jgi:hypothetical protein
VAGASLKDEYLDAIRGAGFQDVCVVGETVYVEDEGPGIHAASVQVEAWKLSL